MKRCQDESKAILRPEQRIMGSFWISVALVGVAWLLADLLVRCAS